MTYSHLFSPFTIAGVEIKNRIVRSATWDPAVILTGEVGEEVLKIYRDLARGGAGLIITGDFPVTPQGAVPSRDSYGEVRIPSLRLIAQAVHREDSEAKVFAQLSTGYIDKGPSERMTPFGAEPQKAFTVEEIENIVHCCAEAITDVQAMGFDGVQFHAAHGGILSAFLSPFTNRRTDRYGGSLTGRTRILEEILSLARPRAGDYPIILKVNGTDNIPGGIDEASFPPLAAHLSEIGLDALEISGGMWEALPRGEKALGFPAVPAPESHTKIGAPEKQSYYLPSVKDVEGTAPLILVGGNRNPAALDAFVGEGIIDAISLCRPLICEPDLPNRWAGGNPELTCISCNSCIFDMYSHMGRGEPHVTRCLYKKYPKEFADAQKWLASWVEENCKNS